MSNPYGKNVRQDSTITTARNLAKTTEFVNALRSETGKLLFNDLAELLDEKFKLIYEEEANEKDMATFRACKYIAGRWNGILDAHNTNLNKMEDIKEREGSSSK